MQKNIQAVKPLARIISAITAAGVMAAVSSAALAQDKPALEEILVTATKREQSVQEIPLSVTAVTGEKLDEAGIENLADLTALVPNIHFTQTGLSTQMRIRGIGSDNSQGFEQSVGVYVDGIFRGRAQLFRAPMFDMERVEVLRGPQSTLFGKNSIAGALDLITAKPTDELSGSLIGSYEAEYGTTEITSIVSGPLTDTLKGRIALRKYDDPGYFKNTYKNTDEPEQDIASGRLSLEWSPNSETSITYIGEHNTFDVIGRPIEITQDLPNAAGVTYSQVLQGLNRAGFDAEQNYERQSDANEFSDNTMTSHTLKAEWDVNGYTVTSLSGKIGYDYKENCDCDFTAANVFNLALKEDYSQVSQEIRIASPIGQKVEWLGGVFFQTYDQSFYDLLKVPAESLVVESVKQSTFDGAVANLAAANNLTVAQAINVPAIKQRAEGAAALVEADFANSGVSRQFDQSSNTQAIFGQATWNLTDEFRFIFGGRYTQESKSGNKELHTVDVETGNYQPVNQQLLAVGLPSAADIYASDVFKANTEEAKNPP